MSTLFVTHDTGEPEEFQDFLNAVLTFAVMGIEVKVLFMGSSVEWLTAESNDPEQQQRVEALQELKNYAVESVYAPTKTLQTYALQESDLCLEVTPLGNQQLKTLFSASDSVLSF